MSTDIEDKIIKRLEQEEEGLPPLLQFYQELLRIQSKVKKRIGTPSANLTQKAATEKIVRGEPLLSIDKLDLDWSLLQEAFTEVIAIFARYPQLFGEISETLRKPEAGHLLTKKIVKTWFEGSELPPALQVDITHKSLLQAIIQATLKPFLAKHAQALIGFVEQAHWRRRYCPVCGGSPDFAFLDKEVGARWLLCSRCDTEWLFQRLECPYCGTQDQQTLSYFTDDKELYRLYVCERCKRYLKAIDLRQAKSEVLLPLERFYTLDLDAQAQRQGYSLYDKPVE